MFQYAFNAKDALTKEEEILAGLQTSHLKEFADRKTKRLSVEAPTQHGR
jgi:hypothetical protein